MKIKKFCTGKSSSVLKQILLTADYIVIGRFRL